jgi:hypothetical protein
MAIENLAPCDWVKNSQAPNWSIKLRSYVSLSNASNIQVSNFKGLKCRFRITHLSQLRSRIKHLIGRINTWLAESTLDWQNQYLILLLDPYFWCRGIMGAWMADSTRWEPSPTKQVREHLLSGISSYQMHGPPPLHCIASTLIKYTTTSHFPWIHYLILLGKHWQKISSVCGVHLIQRNFSFGRPE